MRSEYLCKQSSSNDKISYTLVLLINHDDDSLDFGYYVSDVFDSSTGIWWHCDDDNITEFSGLPKGVYYRDTHKHMKKKKKIMAGSTDVLFVVYIITSHLTKHSSNCLQEITAMSKITHMKKVIKDRYMFRSDFKFIQEVNDEMQTSIFYIKDQLQNSIENNILGKTRKEKSFWFHGDGLKELLTMNPMEKHKKINTTSENMTYLIYNKTNCVSITNCTCLQMKEKTDIRKNVQRY